MTDFQKTPELAKAVINLIKSVGPIAKNLEVGSGQNAYKGVADKDVKDKVGQALAECGLCILPIDVEAREEVVAAKNKYGEEKLNTFTSVKTKYLLLHTSGESVVLTGYGHGVDTQDKAAGKATTYALKYLLLYLSMAPTGTLDDADNTHSDNLPPRTVVPPSQPAPSAPKPTPQQSVQSFESQAKPSAASAPQSTPASQATAQPSGRHKLVKNDEKWARVIDWATANKGKDFNWIIEKLSVNNELTPETINDIKETLGL